MKRLTTLLITIFALGMLVILPVYAHGGKDDPQHHKHPTKTPTCTATPHHTATPHPTQTPQHPHPTQTPQHPHPTPHPGIYVDLRGVVQVMEDDFWIIDEIRVAVNDDTVINEQFGPAELGALVDVKALRQEDGSLLAVRIVVKRDGQLMNAIQFEGMIQTMSQSMWIVGGRQVVIDDDTEVDETQGQAQVGAHVMVQAILEADDLLHARRITVLAHHQNHASPVSWVGVLESMEDDVWTVEGRDVVVDARTQLITRNGPLEVGATVHVYALQLENDVLWAQRIETVGAQPPAADVQFSGVIEAQAEDSWVIDGITVFVDENTIIDEREGPAVVGAMVGVRAVRLDDSALYAERIHVKNELPDGFKIEFRGPIEAMSNTKWRVAGFDITVDDATRFVHLERAELGAVAEVNARRMEDGSLLAIEIDIKGVAADQLRQVEWKGPLERFDDTQWQVAGLTALIDDATIIYGEPALDAVVEVHAWVQEDGSFLAYKLIVEPDARISFTGQVEAITPDAWTISGVLFKVDTRTVYDEDNGPLGIGVDVTVKAMKLADGSFLAMRIETRD